MNSLKLKLLSLVATVLYLYIVYALTFRGAEPVASRPPRRETDTMESFILTAISLVIFLAALKYNYDTACYLK